MYKHLSREERYQIHSLLKAKQTLSEITRFLGRNCSTISRELSRGRCQRGYRAEQACAKASERSQRSRNAHRVDSKVWADVDFYLGIQWSPERLQASWLSAMRAFICLCMRTKLPVVIYTRTCAAKSPGENAICADATDAGKSPTAARSARDQAILKIASKWATGKVTLSLAWLTNKPS